MIGAAGDQSSKCYRPWAAALTQIKTIKALKQTNHVAKRFVMGVCTCIGDCVVLDSVRDSTFERYGILDGVSH